MFALAAGTLAFAASGAGLAHAQAQVQAPNTTVSRAPATVGGLVARTIDLQPIPSRIAHGVVSVRNTGTSASLPSVVTINCHRPGQEGGCEDIPGPYIAQYTNAAYPNRLVVNVPAIQPGHVYNHNLPFWDAMDWPSGEAFQFDYVADAGATNNESNEGNNTGSYVWNVP